MCALFVSSVLDTGALSSIIFFLFLIYSSAIILFCCKRSKRKNKKNIGKMSKLGKQSKDSKLTADCELDEKQKKRMNGQHGSGEEYQTLAGLDGDLFLQAGAYKRRDSVPKKQRKAEGKAKKKKQKRDVRDFNDDIYEDDPNPFTADSELKKQKPGRSLLSAENIKFKQSLMSHNNRMSRAKSVFV